MFDCPRKLNSQTEESAISEEANNTITKNAVRTDNDNMSRPLNLIPLKGKTVGNQPQST